MHIFYQKEISRMHELEERVFDRGWKCYRIDTGNFVSSAKEVDQELSLNVRGEPVFGFASLRLASQNRHLGLEAIGRGIVMDQRKLTWSSYSTILPPDLLLNSFAVLFPWGSLLDPRAIDTLKSACGNESVFLRPNSPLKPFTGFSTTWKDYEYNINSYAQLEAISPGEIVAAFPSKEMDKVEWRFWVVAGEVATFSPYSWEELPVDNLEVPPGMMDDVSRVISHLEGYEDSLVVDMVATSEGNRLVEINGLSTSGFYTHMNVDALLDALPRMYGL